MFVPYEFEARLFRGIYPSLRSLGLALLAAGLGLAFAVSWGRRGAARWMAAGARLFFMGALGLFWWQVSIGPGSLTGAVAFPLLVVGVVLEVLPRWASGGLLRPFLAVLGVGFGVLMWAAPASFPARIFGQVTEVLRPL